MPSYFDQGFCVREPSWHREEVLLQEYPGREEAMVLAGHNFEVVSMPVFLPADVDGTIDDELVETPEWQAIARSDTGKVFQIARDTYHIVQNDVPWDILDAMVNETNVKYETAGILRDGSVLWALARIDEPVRITGDISDIYPFVVVSWSHDGTGAIRADSTDIRVVCWNTFSMATSKADREGLTFTFRHTEKVMDRIDAARDALKGARVKHTAFVALAEELAKLRIRPEAVNAFLVEFIPQPPGDVVSDRVMRNIEEAREAVLGILNGPSLAEVPLTAYKFMQAGVEYLDHLRGFRTQDSYLGRTLLKQDKLKDKLVPLVKNLHAEFGV